MTLTPARRGKRSRPEATVELDSAAIGLLEALRAWRVRASNGKPAYTVAHNSTLESIATLRPSSMDQLARIKGIGPAFVERHGETVLEIVAAG